jgi:N-acetylglutamate synthase-like GNAT family acetyltransferase
MNTNHVEIVSFEPGHQMDIDIMMGAIASEFQEPIFPRAGSVVSIPISDRRLWVAVSGGMVVGTVGVLITVNSFAVLKSMFVAKEYRRTSERLGSRLLKTAIDFAVDEGACTMYLGTMTQFKAAQQFYAAQGFEKIPESELPIGFPGNELDTIFFRKAICQGR